jgi:PhzF family phenazine biosynthesis protein
VALVPATSRKQECNKTIYHIFKQNIPNIWYNSQLFVFLQRQNIKCLDMKQYRYVKSNAFAHTRVFAPKFGYLEDPATGSGNSAFANYLLSEGLWKGEPITIEQGGNDRIFNSVKLKCQDGKVLFGGKATKKIEGEYFI